MFVDILPPLSLDDRHERRARQLARLEELAELGMGLARLAAKRAEAEMRDCGAEDAGEAPEQAPEQAPGQAAERRLPAVLVFERLARNVRQLTALEARIANGFAPLTEADPGTDETGTESRADSRRAVLYREFYDAAATRRDGAKLRPRIDTLIETLIRQQPPEQMPIGLAIFAIAEELGMPVDFDAIPEAWDRKTPDAILTAWDQPPPPPREPGAPPRRWFECSG